MREEMMTDTPKVVFHSETTLPTEMKHLNVELDPSILDQDKVDYVKFNMNKQQLTKLKNEYKRKMKRYRTYSFKAPRNRDPKLHNDSFMVTNDKYLNKYKLHDYMVKSDDDEYDS